MAAFEYAYRMVCVILWKSWRIRKHRKLQTFLEIAAPVLLVLLLVSVKAVMEPEAGSNKHRPTLYAPLDMKALISKLCTIGCSEGKMTSILAYSPNTTYNNELMKTVQDTLVANEAKMEVHGFQKEYEIEALSYLLKLNTSGYFGYHASLSGAVVFMSSPNMTKNTDEFAYKIRLMTPKFITGKIFPDIGVPGPGSQFEEYESTGFLGLQMALENAIRDKLNEDETKSAGTINYTVETQAFPYPPFVLLEKSHYTMVLATLLPAAIIIGFAYLATVTIAGVVSEKETGVKQLLTMLGLSNAGYWFGWLVNVFCVALIAVMLIVGILSANISGDGAVLKSSSISVIWAFLLLYIFAALWFCFFITTLFYSASHAKALGFIIWIGTFLIPALLIGTKQRYLATQLLLSTLPNMCLYWGFSIIASWESRVVGVHWDNLTEYASSTDSLNLASLFAMLVFDGIFYMILTTFMRYSDLNRRKLKNPYQLMYDVLYDDTKFPEFIRFFKKGCRCKKKIPAPNQNEPGGDEPFESPIGILRTKVLENLGLLHSSQLQRSITPVNLEKTDEIVPRECGIKIRNVTKLFQSETALRKISCDFYTNEITCICGENGSGKTTLIQILLGIMKADEGTVYVNRYDVNDYVTDVRRSVGLCPQKNMIFSDLTVMEHLIIFAWLKGKAWSEARGQAVQLISMLKLKDKSKTLAKNLSATEKRKLCFGIALSGEPKIILLDEATLEMDAESTKTVWNVLMKVKEGKTILMTTNNIEEADSVADRIAVMNGGILRCHGSPEQLGKIFGNGYTIKLGVSNEGAEKLIRMISQEIQYADIKSRTMAIDGEDIIFVVPDLYAPLFPKIFHQLFENKDDFGILSIDIHTTSFEEIFHSVHELREFENSLPTNLQTEVITSSYFTGRKLEGYQLGVSRFWALIKKNYWMTQSNKQALIFQIVIPLLLILCGITGANRGLRNRDTERFSQININLNDYTNPVTLYTIANANFKTSYEQAVGPSAKSSDYDKNISEAVMEIGVKDIASYRRQYIVGVTESNWTITAMYSTVPYNSPPLSLNLVSNALLKFMNPNTSRKIVVENHPMQNVSDDDDETSKALNGSGTSSTSVLLKSFCFYFAYALAIILAMVSIKPLKERVTGSHHLQTMTGINPLTFWFAYGIVDGAFMLLFSAITLLITYICQERYIFTMNGGAVALFTIVFIGGLACISFAYLFSQLVNNAAAGFGWLNMLHLLAALGSYVMYQTHEGITDSLSEFFYWISIPFPIPFIVHAMYTYSRLVMDNSRCEVLSEHLLSSVCKKNQLYIYLPVYSCCPNCISNQCFEPKSFFSTSYGFEGYTLLRDLITLALLAVFYTLIVVLMDYNYFQKLNRYFLSAPSEVFDNNEKDEKYPSAAQEAELVRKLVGMGETIDDSGLLVDGLCKNYGSTAAFSSVSFSVNKGECFGLLGLKGAGKSSVFKTLVGEELPAVGEAYISPYRMLGNPREFSACIGYCPQKNSLLRDLTGRQMLQLYGSLRGVCNADLKIECQQWLSALGLENDADRQCKTYSRGMRRRLAVAIALISGPKVIILDEPTKNIDQAGKKHLWSILQRLKRDGKIILLASPNVRECENLCGRIGLMINGRLQYVGTTREIKSKFLNGYTVSFRLKKQFTIDDEGDLEIIGDLRASIEAILEDGVLRDAHHNTIKYLIPQKGQDWGSIIEKLEKIRTSMSDSIEYYSLTESDLEEVFNAMAELDTETSNELPFKVTFFQRILMNRCCSDDFS